MMLLLSLHLFLKKTLKKSMECMNSKVFLAISYLPPAPEYFLFFQHLNNQLESKSSRFCLFSTFLFLFFVFSPFYFLPPTHPFGPSMTSSNFFFIFIFVLTRTCIFEKKNYFENTSP